MASPFQPPGPTLFPPLRRGGRRIVLGALAVLFVALIGLPVLTGFATDWLWFSEIGFERVFFTSLLWRGLLFVVGGTFALGVLHLNVRLALGGTTGFPALVVTRSDGQRIDLSRVFPKLLFAATVFVAFVFGISIAALWMTALKGLHGVSAGVTDPLFGRDVGFYLFQLPAITALLNTLIALTTLSLVAAATLYAIRGELVLPPRRVSAGPGASRHVGTLLAIFFVLTALRLWFAGSADLLYSTTGPLVGASYTDVHVRLPGLRLSAIVALLAAGTVAYGTWRGMLVRLALISVVAYAGVSILARELVPRAVQKLIVAPNELSREQPYLEAHITATRRAWRLDSVATRDLDGDVQLSMADIRANAATIGNVRLWERELLQQTFSQLQEIRTYYDFHSVHDDRYMIDGKYRQVHLAARELNTSSLPTRNFINERLTYTHGMGLTLAPVNEVTREGLPVLFIKDLPPASSVTMKVTRPQVYYGQLTSSYVFTGTAQEEFDYPAGESDVYSTYTGRGGVPIGSVLKRALFAWQLRSLNVLLRGDISGGARVLYRRNVSERARLALPFLDFDSEPYLMVTDAGELKWILDAYTTSTRYPYAQRTTAGTNYMRNSVKVVIDAYDGTVDAYIADPGDPVVRTYARIFPGIFKAMDAMPADVRRHVRYPGDLFRVQTAFYATYHMVQPQAFYHREDQWQYPALAGKPQSTTAFLRHIILRLPGEPNPEFIYMTPFTPRGKDNLAAWMVARMDGEHYGKLVVYRFPEQSLVFGPSQITNRINQDTEISRQIALWDQGGSQVIRGELLVIPIEESLIYVQPIYLRATGGTIPELKRVVVAVENRVVMEETLDQGLAALFGGGAGARVASAARDTLGAAVGASAAAGATPSSVAALLQEAQQHYDRALAAQRAGNWAEYGREIEQLGAALRRLRSVRP